MLCRGTAGGIAQLALTHEGQRSMWRSRRGGDGEQRRGTRLEADPAYGQVECAICPSLFPRSHQLYRSVCSLIFRQLRLLDTEEKHLPLLFRLAAYHAVL